MLATDLVQGGTKLSDQVPELHFHTFRRRFHVHRVQGHLGEISVTVAFIILLL